MQGYQRAKLVSAEEVQLLKALSKLVSYSRPARLTSQRNDELTLSHKVSAALPMLRKVANTLLYTSISSESYSASIRSKLSSWPSPKC